MGNETSNDGRNSSHRDFEAIKRPSPDVGVPPQARGTEPGPAYRQALDAINGKDRVDQQLRDWQAQLAAKPPKPRGDQPASSMTIREKMAMEFMAATLDPSEPILSEAMENTYADNAIDLADALLDGLERAPSLTERETPNDCT